MATNRFTLPQETRKLHRQNMQQTLMRRMAVAKAAENQALIAMLENEQKELALW
ncbi:MAG: hypothetical protein KME07_06855 [Pegethrix bostrychoides GSE-TBD4-15B]|uniref:Uncharacterized protein n=1 Tax=Pegethrix bostrychoides GSE-TBD4-15B TaxID=2839662 RepID=A0A951P8V1_9CYAN|nr:hypothetical protein [Pegethrix bostrychoides GSE-TBD4-15B]